MKRCINCEHCRTHEILYVCNLGGFVIQHPLLMGGPKKCECYEKRHRDKEQIIYPRKEQQNG